MAISDQNLRRNLARATILVNGYSQTFNMAYVGAQGMADRATARYVQVDIDSGMSIASSTITDWLSIIIEFSILGLVIGIVKKTGRWQ